MPEGRIWDGSDWQSITDEDHRNASDPHSQYHNNARGDARYSPLGHLHPDATTADAGFMSTTDKTKLDGVESGATADQTASEILTAVKTVDGAGSGLDADTLDGTSSAGFAASTHAATHKGDGADPIANATTSVAGLESAADKTKLDGIESGATADQTASEILTAVKTVDGAGSGLDADTLDGTEGSGFATASHSHAAADVTSGTFAVARLATGTPDGTKFVADDGTLKTPSGGTTPQLTHLKRLANQTVNSDTLTAVSWDTETLDEGNLWTSGDPTKVVSATGLYMVVFQGRWVANSTGQRYHYVMRRSSGGTLLDYEMSAIHAANTDSSGRIAVPALLKLDSGDYITCEVFQTSGTARSLGSAGIEGDPSCHVKVTKLV